MALDQLLDEAFPVEAERPNRQEVASSAGQAPVTGLDRFLDEAFGETPAAPAEQPGLLSRAASAVTDAVVQAIPGAPVVAKALGFKSSGPAVSPDVATAPKSPGLPQIQTNQDLRATTGSAAVVPGSRTPTPPIPVKLGPVAMPSLEPNPPAVERQTMPSLEGPLVGPAEWARQKQAEEDARRERIAVADARRNLNVEDLVKAATPGPRVGPLPTVADARAQVTAQGREQADADMGPQPSARTTTETYRGPGAGASVVASPAWAFFDYKQNPKTWSDRIYNDMVRINNEVGEHPWVRAARVGGNESAVGNTVRYLEDKVGIGYEVDKNSAPSLVETTIEATARMAADWPLLKAGGAVGTQAARWLTGQAIKAGTEIGIEAGLDAATASARAVRTLKASRTWGAVENSVNQAGAFGAMNIGGTATSQLREGRFDAGEYAESVASGLVTGAVGGAAGGAFRQPVARLGAEVAGWTATGAALEGKPLTLQDFIVTGVPVAVVMAATRAFSRRPIVQRAYLDILKAHRGQAPAAITRVLEAEAKARGKDATPEQLLKSVLDKAQERAAKAKPGEEPTALEAELKGLFAQEVGDVATGTTATELRSAREVAEQKTGGPVGPGKPAPAKPAPEPQVILPGGQPGVVPSGPVQILGPTGRPMEAAGPAVVPEAPTQLRTAQERAEERARGIRRQVAPAPQGTPAAVPAMAETGRPAASLNFKDYVELAGKKWPLTSRDPDFARLRFEFDDLRKGLYEARPSGDGRWAVINRKTGEDVDHLQTGAKAQLEANRLNSVVTLDAWRNAQIPAPIRMTLPERPPMVTLYRGEAIPKGTKLPDWVEEGIRASGSKDAEGRWFTDDSKIAEWYLDEAGVGRIVKVEVPQAAAEEWRATKNPEALKFSRDPEREFFVPPEIAAQRKVDLSAKPAPEAKIEAGMIRLYRGEGLRDDRNAWKDPAMVQFQGRWFTPDPSLAESHGKDVAGREARMLFVDVPKSVYEASRVSSKPDLAKFLYGGPAEPDTALLPPAWASKASDLSAKPAPEPKVEGAAAAQQQAERAAIEGPKPSAEPPAEAKVPTPPAMAGVVGRPQEIRVPAGSKYQTRYEVVEAEDLIPSHNPKTFAKDARYPEGVQNRPYHSDKSEQAKVIRQGQDFEPLFLVSPQPSSGGTPIVAPDSNVVLSGNSRTMSLLRTMGTPDFEKYREALANMVPVLGIKPEDIANIKNPVLVRRLVGTDTTPEFYRRFAAETNQGFKGPLSKEAKAELRVAEEPPPYRAAEGEVVSGSPAGPRPTEASRAGEAVGEFMKSPIPAPPLTQADPSQVSMTQPGRVSRETAPSFQIMPPTPSMAPTSTPSLTQPTSSVQELLATATRAKPAFDAALAALTERIQGADFMGSRVKSESSTIDKMQRKPGLDPNTFDDYLGGRIQADTPETLAKVTEAIRGRFGEIVEDNFLERPNIWGYRANHVSVKLPSGFIAEIQVAPEPITRYQEIGDGHRIYGRWRNKRPETPEEKRQATADMTESNARYQEAYDQWTGRPSLVAEPETPTVERPSPTTLAEPTMRVVPAKEPAIALEQELGELFAIRGGSEGPSGPPESRPAPPPLAKETREKLVQYGQMIFAESPARSYPDFARRITEKLGDRVRPYLPDVWGEVLREIARTQKPLPGGQGRGGAPPEVPPKIPTSAPPLEPPPGLTEPQLKLGLHKDVVDAALDLFKAGKIERDPKTLISDQILDAIHSGTLRIEDMAKVLGEHGMTFTEFGVQMFRPAITDAAKRLGALGQLQRRLNELERELGGSAGGEPGKGGPGGAERAAKIQTIGDILDAAKTIDPVSSGALSWWRRADGIRRGLMVTQLATAVRNFGSQVGRLGVDVLDQGLQGGLQRIFGKEVTHHPADSMRTLVDVFSQLSPGRHKEMRARVDALLEGLPRGEDRLFNNYTSDLTRVAKDQKATTLVEKGLTTAEKATQMLNVFNRFQEYVVRRSVFQAELAARLRRRGIDIEAAINDKDTRRAIPFEDIRMSIDKALEVTFADSPAYGSTGYHFIKVVNSLPGATFLLPFPRFMVNSIKFLYEFSPLGAVKVFSKAEQMKIRQGDMKTISRATIGFGMLGTAFLIRSMQDEDTKWNEIRLPGMTRTLDVRPYNPFAAYLFVAEVARRYANGTLYGGGLAGETIKNVLGANVRGGTGLQTVDQLVDGLRDIGDAQALKRYMQGFGGNLVAGLLTPLQQLTDAYAQFDPESQILRSTREHPFTGPIKQRFPSSMVEALGGELPPERASATSEEPQRRESPGLRQIMGLTFGKEKNDFEKELDRLQFSYQDIMPRSGDPRLNNIIARHMGAEAEVGNRIVNSARYQRLGEIAKRLELRSYLQRLRKKAKAKAMLDRGFREIDKEVRAGTSKERLAELAREEKAGLR